MIPILTEIEFLTWCEKNNISNKTKEYINNNIRFAQPARSVGGGEKSISGKYPSKKMGVFIQWESGKVEGPAVLMMENDEKVLEFYDQPNMIKLNYLNDAGRKRGVLYTPDFFVIRKDGASWEEWKKEEDLMILSKKQPWKYVKDENGEWRCPPGEQFAESIGLSFKVRTDQQINWSLHRNYVFLDDYLRRSKSLRIDSVVLEEVKRIIFQEPGLTLKHLLDQIISRGYKTDDIFAYIINNLIYVDLNAEVLAEPETVKVFLHKDHAKMYTNLIECSTDLPSATKFSFKVGTSILWDNCVWTLLNVGDTHVSLFSEGKLNEIPREVFDTLVNKGKIIGEAKEDLVNDPIIDLITSADEEGYKKANYRLRHVKAYLERGSIEYKNKKEPNLRKVRDWTSKFRKAEQLFGNGYVGLLPKDKNKGNKNNRLPNEVVELMNKYIEEHYETIIQKSMSVVYGSFKNDCEEKGYTAPSLVTFSKHVNNRPIQEQVKKRKGRRASYQKSTFYWELERTTPRHGDFPFNICHLDHTELDIELVCSQTEKNLGRPYLSLMIDAYSRRVLSFFLSFEPPSYRSCLMVFRDCVRRYNRLPQQIVVDNGKEFHSVYFETLLAMYEKEPKWRPAAEPRYGSILERLFGTTNTNFIHNLIGNTKIMKNVREVTKSVNPKMHAIWSLANLSSALNDFFFEIYDAIEHPALGQSPREAFKQGLLYSGERQDFHIPFDRLFEIFTLPSTKNGEATIQQSGIKINYIYYWNDEFKSLHYKKLKVKVRFDPFNLGVAYAYVNNRWIKCISQYYSLFKHLTQKELKFITTEMRKVNQNHLKQYTINAQRIAKFIDELENNRQYSLLKSKVNESKKVIKLFYTEPNNDDSNDEDPPLQKKVDQEMGIQKMNVQNHQLDIYGEF